jgi:hypothetical protein
MVAGANSQRGSAFIRLLPTPGSEPVSTKMGIQSMVKHATRNMMMNNSSNTRTGRLLTERATDIAQDMEHSGNPARRVDPINRFWTAFTWFDQSREAQLKQIITEVAAEFEGDDLQSQTDPVSFLKRQKAIIQADAQLDIFQVR